MTLAQRGIRFRLAFAAALLPAVSALAQPAPVTRPATTQPSTTQAATAPATTQAATQPTRLVGRNGPATTRGLTTQPGGGLLLHFQDASIDAVLDELSTAAGFIVVKEVKPEGRVTLVSKQPVKPDEAIPLLNSVLKNAGYTAIQQERILKIVARDKAKRSNIPVRSGANPKEIANNDELITQVIPLKYADAVQLKQDLSPLVSTEADFTANASSNALVMTDTSANIRRLVEIVAALDTSLADAAEVKVFKLNYASASAAAKLITDVFVDQTQQAANQRGGGNNPFRRFFGGGGGGGFGGPDGGGRGGGGGSESSGPRRTTPRVQASSDERTNTVVVTGPTDTLKIIEKVVKDLDSDPAAEETVFIYRLKNAQATNVESVMNMLFNGFSSGTRGSSNANSRNTNSNRASSSNRLSGGSNRSTGSSRSSGGGFGSSGGGFGSSGTSRFGSGGFGGFGGTGGGFSASANRTAADLSGQVNIIADPDTNSLLVRTKPLNYERVKLVLEELDRPVQQVLIKVLIAEVTHDNSSDIGTEFSVLNLRASGLGQRVGTNFNVARQTTGLVVNILEQDFQTTIRLLESVGKLDVLSRPYILASDNQLATITVGQEVPFITNSRITDTGQTINTIEYDDIGILLDVIPHINPDGLVTLDVAPEISTLTGSTVPISDTISAPVIAKRSAQSRVAIKNGQTVVIGGLMEDRKVETIDKVPFLGDIPLLGDAFKRKQDKKSKTELLIFLTPHVASMPDALSDITKQEVDGTKLVPGAVDPKSYKDHREGLDRGAVQNPDRSPEFKLPQPQPRNRSEDEQR